MGKYSSSEGILAGGRLQTEKEENKEAQKRWRERRRQMMKRKMGEPQMKASSPVTNMCDQEKKRGNFNKNDLFFFFKLCI